MLRELLDQAFDAEGLRTLCFDLWVDYDNLPGEGKASRIRELIIYLERRNRIPEFVEYLKHDRPDISWETLLQTKPPAFSPQAAETPLVPGETRPSRHSANRYGEIQLFKRMRDDPNQERILLIQGSKGQGKTTLLKEFVRLCDRRDVVAIDFKGSTLRLSELFARVCERLDWRWFDRVIEKLNELSEINVTRHAHVKQELIATVLSAGDQNSQDANRDKLTRALVEDLCDFHGRPVLIFDTFEEAPPEMRAWFKRAFLPRVYLSPELLIVVAGQEVPERTLEWSGELYLLPPILDPVQWQDYYKGQGMDLHIELVDGVCRTFEGYPAEITKFFGRYAMKAA